MKKITKLITLIIVLSLMLAQLVFADEASKISFTDLDETNWAYKSIDKLVQKGIINGYPDGTFRSDAYITRAELVKITNLVFSYSLKRDATNLIDLKTEDWFYDQVLIAQQAGYINGYEDGSFRPNNYITRQELCKILDAINNFVELPMDRKPADEVSPWAEAYVSKIISNRIMLLDENDNFRATENATRSEVCDVLSKFIVDDIITETPVSQGSSGNQNDNINEQVYEAMDNVILELSTDVLDNMTTELQKEIISDIIINIEAYKTDKTHDYESAAERTYEKYKKLSDEEKEALQYEVKIRNSTKDLLLLKEFFFPDVEI